MKLKHLVAATLGAAALVAGVSTLAWAQATDGGRIHACVHQDGSLRIASWVEDDGVSRKHAKVILSPQGHFQLMDLGSTNGTYLNGIKVSVATLADGDKIQIGSNTVLKFSIQDA